MRPGRQKPSLRLCRDSGARRDLHWLPIEQRIIFKIALLTLNCRRRSAPPYLCDLVHDYLPRRALRSGDGATNEIPRTKTVTAERAFSVAGPTICNDLPLKLRQSINFDGFKTEKTHLFYYVLTIATSPSESFQTFRRVAKCFELN